MAEISGATMFVLELAVTLRDLDYRPEVCAFRIEDPMASELIREGVGYYNFRSAPSLDSFDLLISHHHTLPALLAEQERREKLGTTISVSLSPFDTLEMPGAISEISSLILANSPETERNLIRFGVDQSKIHVFENACPRSFHRTREPIKQLKRLLVVSNHTTPELIEATGRLQNLGIEVTKLGLPDAQKRVDPEILLQHDLVVSIGKTVQYAIVTETPVYVYDKFGGPGWLTPSNYGAALFHNFSGRCCRRKLDSDSIVKEILSGHDRACSSTRQIKIESEDRFDLQSRLKHVISLAGHKPVTDRSLIDMVRREGVLTRELPNYLENEIEVRRQKAALDWKDGEIERRGQTINELREENFALRVALEGETIGRRFSPINRFWKRLKKKV
jgi:hypothetical protein